MKAHATVGRVDGQPGIGRQYGGALSGAIVIFALASGMAVGFGAVVERLTTGAMSSTERAAFFYDEEDGSSCDRAPCHRIRRWLTTTAGSCDATGGRMQHEDPTTGIAVELEVQPCPDGWS
jgi:hypothetical protein